MMKKKTDMYMYVNTFVQLCSDIFKIYNVWYVCVYMYNVSLYVSAGPHHYYGRRKNQK